MFKIISFTICTFVVLTNIYAKDIERSYQKVQVQLENIDQTHDDYFAEYYLQAVVYGNFTGYKGEFQQKYVGKYKRKIKELERTSTVHLKKDTLGSIQNQDNKTITISKEELEKIATEYIAKLKKELIKDLKRLIADTEKIGKELPSDDKLSTSARREREQKFQPIDEKIDEIELISKQIYLQEKDNTSPLDFISLKINLYEDDTWVANSAGKVYDVALNLSRRARGLDDERDEIKLLGHDNLIDSFEVNIQDPVNDEGRHAFPSPEANAFSGYKTKVKTSFNIEVK